MLNAIMGHPALLNWPKLKTTVDATDSAVTSLSELNVEMKKCVLILLFILYTYIHIYHICIYILYIQWNDYISIHAVLPCHGCEKLRTNKNLTQRWLLVGSAWDTHSVGKLKVDEMCVYYDCTKTALCILWIFMRKSRFNGNLLFPSSMLARRTRGC